MLSQYSRIIIICLACMLLQSCFTALGTAVVGGAVIYKRKPLENILNDQHIESQINNAYFTHAELWEQNRVIVSCVNGYVLLTGEVRNSALKAKAVQLAKQVPSISRVYDQIQLGTPVNLIRQSLDGAITLIIKTKMIFANDFDPSNIKVVTNDGVVYIMGVVEPAQADRAAAIASQTSGVKKVVKVFQYIT